MAAVFNYRPSLTVQVFAGLPLTMFAAYQAGKYSEFAAQAIHTTFIVLTGDRLIRTGYAHLQERGGVWNKVKGMGQFALGTAWIAGQVLHAIRETYLESVLKQFLQSSYLKELEQEIDKSNALN